MCAVFSGDAHTLRLLAESRANMNHALEGMSSLGYFDKQTALMAAAKSRQDAAVLTTLLELRADVNARGRTGLQALYFCRTPEHVKTLVEHRAEISHDTLSGAASFASADTVQALISYRCDPSKASRPLHAVALLSRGNCRAVETAKLLLAHRADVNLPYRPPRNLLWKTRTARLRTAVFGYSNCSSESWQLSWMACSYPKHHLKLFSQEAEEQHPETPASLQSH